VDEKMNNLDKNYLALVQDILDNGKEKENRTGVNTKSVTGRVIQHDMSEGFPLLTTKKVSLKNIAIELEAFIKGITDKKWFQDRGCHIWDEWCNPEVVPYSKDPEIQKQMKQERDLGPIYGWEGRHFGGIYQFNTELNNNGIDQLKNIITTLKTNPNDRRMITSYWNPVDLGKQALPSCHLLYQVLVSDIDKKLDMIWYQRSVDTLLGLPYDIASYGLFQTLLCKETGYIPGTLTGFLADTHIYVNHIDGALEQLSRDSFELPQLEVINFTDIFNWTYQDFVLKNYISQPSIKFEIAV
jgi:thymidylate synthase